MYYTFPGECSRRNGLLIYAELCLMLCVWHCLRLLFFFSRPNPYFRIYCIRFGYIRHRVGTAVGRSNSTSWWPVWWGSICCKGVTFWNLEDVEGKKISFLRTIPEPVEKLEAREMEMLRAGAPELCRCCMLPLTRYHAYFFASRTWVVFPASLIDFKEAV